MLHPCCSTCRAVLRKPWLLATLIPTVRPTACSAAQVRRSRRTRVGAFSCKPPIAYCFHVFPVHFRHVVPGAAAAELGASTPSSSAAVLAPLLFTRAGQSSDSGAADPNTSLGAVGALGTDRALELRSQCVADVWRRLTTAGAVAVPTSQLVQARTLRKRGCSWCWCCRGRCWCWCCSCVVLSAGCGLLAL